MSYMHCQEWQDAKFGEEHKRVKRKYPCLCNECQLTLQGKE